MSLTAWIVRLSPQDTLYSRGSLRKGPTFNRYGSQSDLPLLELLRFAHS
jgi:hypothetical protein